MKKNLLGILILGLTFVNIIISGITMFTVMTTNQKTAKVVSDVANAISIDMGTGSSEGEVAQAVPIEDIETYSQKVIKDINDITKQTQKEESLTEQISNTLTEIEANWRNRNDYSLYTGILDLDKKTCGLHNQELTIIGARPGVGKTTLALQIAEKIAMNNKNVLFISLEMSEVQLIQKMIAKEGNINSYKMRMGTLEDKDFETITQVASNISQMNMTINTKIRNIQQKHTFGIT